nr:hypothetical protein [Nitrosomonas sp.]
MKAHDSFAVTTPIRAFAVFAAIAAVTALMYPIAIFMLLWAALRILSGFSIVGVLVVIESWFSSRATNRICSHSCGQGWSVSVLRCRMIKADGVLAHSRFQQYRAG